MSILKAKKQDFELIKRTHPDLYTTINTNFPNIDDTEKGKIAGLCIEYVIQSSGDVDIFQEDLDISEEEFEDGNYDETLTL